MLQEENWDSVYNTYNINEMFNNFQNTLIRNLTIVFLSLRQETDAIVLIGLLME